MSPKKMGRPIKEDAKRTLFRVRLDDELLTKLQECSDSHSVSRSEIIRRGIEIIHADLKK